MNIKSKLLLPTGPISSVGNNTSDQDLLQEGKQDLTTRKLAPVVIGEHYIIGEKMRLGNDGTPPPALKQQGRFRTLDQVSW